MAEALVIPQDAAGVLEETEERAMRLLLLDRCSI